MNYMQYCRFGKGFSLLVFSLLLFSQCQRENTKIYTNVSNHFFAENITRLLRETITKSESKVLKDKSFYLIHLKEENNLPKGLVNPGKIKYDGFHLVINDTAITIGALETFGIANGIYFLEEMLLHTVTNEIDTVRSPFFAERAGGIFETAQRIPEDFDEDAYAYWLSRHGINYNGIHKGRANINDSSAAKYGIYLYSGGSANIFYKGWEKQKSLDTFARWYKLHPDAVTESEPNSHTGKTLPTVCIKSSFGQQKYEEEIVKMLKPEQVNRLLFTFGDWGSVCGPACPNCGHLPLWERIADWLGIVQGMADSIKPGAKAIGRTWYFTHDIIDSLITHAPPGVGIRTKEPTSIILDTPLGSHALEQDNYSDIMLVKKELDKTYGPIYLSGPKKRGDDFYAASGFGDTGESVDPVIGMATPFITAFKIHRMAENDIRNICVWWGGLNNLVYSINHEVIAKMIWDPFQDQEQLIMNIAKRDFGNQADSVYHLWEKIDLALDTWNYVNWQQQFEEFVNRSDSLFFKPLTPEIIKNNNWTGKMWPNKDLLLENEKEVLGILNKAVILANNIHQKASNPEIKERSQQQYHWLRLYSQIMQSQYNTLLVMEYIDKKENTKSWVKLLEEDYQNTENIIQSLQEITYPGVILWGRFETTRENIEMLEKKLEQTKDRIKLLEKNLTVSG